MANRQSTRQQVVAALSRIVCLPLTAAGRAADMRMFDFGHLRSAGNGFVIDYALHVQCAWRIESNEGIVTGRSDLWKPVDDHAPFDEDWDYDTSPNLQDNVVALWLTDNASSLVVQNVDADEFGGAAIGFDQGFSLRLFPAGTRSEDWRLFQPKTAAAHFVVSGGEIESDE